MKRHLLFTFIVFNILLHKSINAQNNSFNFNGNSYVDIGNSVADSLRTIEFWFNLDNNIDSNLSQFRIPMQRNKVLGANQNEFAFTFDYNVFSSAGQLRFKLNDAFGTKHEVFSDTNAWASNVWHHAAAVIDSAKGLMLFIDGKLQQSKDSTWTSPIGSSNDIVAIGCNGSAFNYFFEGKMDEVRFSTIARYTSDFTPACRFTTDQYTRALYNFDTLSNLTTAIDSSSNNYSGTTSNVTLDNANSCGICSALDSITVVSCGAYDSPSGKYTWTKSGNYKDTILAKFSCDSIFSIQLTVDSASTSFMYDTACVSYQAPSGKTYTSGGLFYDTITNSSGCDSIITIFLTLNNTTNSSILVSSCQSYVSPSGKIVANSGIFSDTIPNKNRCDSIISISLSIDTISNSVTVNGNNIIANQNNVSYQWLDCNNNYAELLNDTNQSFSSFYSGSYAVEVSNSCVDTSACTSLTIVGIEEMNVRNIVTITPNPSKDGIFTISSTKRVESVYIYSLEGKLIEMKPANNNKIDLNDYSSGFYLLRLMGENFDIKKKVIIENLN